jgi:hypothetical protein
MKTESQKIASLQTAKRNKLAAAYHKHFKYAERKW